MTAYQERLLSEARDMWERGHRIPTDLYARMAQEGLDVQTLEETYYKEQQNDSAKSNDGDRERSSEGRSMGLCRH